MELELDEKDVMIKKDYHENICARYNISRETIKGLLKNMKNDPSYLRKQNAKNVCK